MTVLSIKLKKSISKDKKIQCTTSQINVCLVIKDRV